jgi:hypothetical protein
MIFMLERAGWVCERIVPFNDLEWVDVAWAPAVRALTAPAA